MGQRPGSTLRTTLKNGAQQSAKHNHGERKTRDKGGQFAARFMHRVILSERVSREFQSLKLSSRRLLQLVIWMLERLFPAFASLSGIQSHKTELMKSRLSR